MTAATVHRYRTIFVVVLLVQVLLALGVAYLYSALSNTLRDNGRWDSTKVGLARGVMGAKTFITDRRTLSREQLDLGRWHGHQEVAYREPLALQTASVDFLVEPNAYLIFIFGKSAEEFYGLRLSRHPRFDSLFFRARDDGEFTATQPLTNAVPIDDWMQLRMEFEPSGVTAFVDETAVGRFAAVLPDRQVVGFRGSDHRAVIDNIRLAHAGGVVVETFFNQAGFMRGLVMVSVLFVLIDTIAVCRDSLMGTASLKTPFVVLTATLAMLVCVGLFLVAYNVVISRGYLSLGFHGEEDYRIKWVSKTTAEIRARYPTKPPPDTTRVLVVGTSQTWGAGAAHEEETFVRILERRLDDTAPAERSFECINAGISALNAPWLLQLYRDEWIRLAPQVLVLNLATNDGGLKQDDLFIEVLNEFVRLSREQGIAVLFVLEANSIEHSPGELRLHPIMRDIAEQHGVPLFDMHDYVSQQTRRGLLWWDFVHPTSFGHRVLADALAPEVAALIDE
ncbi:MAG: GDSL-type esterase/lipase family protein [Pirellulaceae bacterium]|nr:GDSL-type esterase/lipase family protein [Pirellulaceae bacterium]